MFIILNILSILRPLGIDHTRDLGSLRLQRRFHSSQWGIRVGSITVRAQETQASTLISPGTNDISLSSDWCHANISYSLLSVSVLGLGLPFNFFFSSQLYSQPQWRRCDLSFPFHSTLLQDFGERGSTAREVRPHKKIGCYRSRGPL